MPSRLLETNTSSSSQEKLRAESSYLRSNVMLATISMFILYARLLRFKSKLAWVKASVLILDSKERYLLLRMLRMIFLRPAFSRNKIMLSQKQIANCHQNEHGLIIVVKRGWSWQGFIAKQQIS